MYSPALLVRGRQNCSCEKGKIRALISHRLWNLGLHIQIYEKNFNCYLNLWRIEEYQILMAHPSNERKNPYQVMVMAGFKDSRHFQRAIRLEKAAKKQPDEKPQIKNKEG